MCVFSINIVSNPVYTRALLFLVICLSLFILRKLKMAFSLLREVQYLDPYSLCSVNTQYLHIYLSSVEILLLLVIFVLGWG